jgi:hypothetical protein
MYEVIVYFYVALFLLNKKSILYSLSKKKKMSIVPPVYHIALVKKRKKVHCATSISYSLIKKKKKSPLCKVMEDTGIKYPLSLDIDMRGQLWVGCCTGGKQSGAKIFFVK